MITSASRNNRQVVLTCRLTHDPGEADWQKDWWQKDHHSQQTAISPRSVIFLPSIFLPKIKEVEETPHCVSRKVRRGCAQRHQAEPAAVGSERRARRRRARCVVLFPRHGIPPAIPQKTHVSSGRELPYPEKPESGHRSLSGLWARAAGLPGCYPAPSSHPRATELRRWPLFGCGRGKAY